MKNFLQDNGPSDIDEIEKHILNSDDKYKKLYMQLFDGDSLKLSKYLHKGAEDIHYNKSNKKFEADEDVLEKYETPEDMREGKFKLYLRKDENLNLAIQLDKPMIWNIRINNVDDVFNLFGKSKKFPAQIEKNSDKTKLIDEGDITLGVQRHGYHEYFLVGNKFESKLHFRVVPMEGAKYWVAFTSVKQAPVDKESDDGVWDIYADKYENLTFKNLKEQ